LVFHAEPLFEQSIDVWSGDPVIKELYDAHNEQYEMDLSGVAKLGNPDALCKTHKKTVQTVES